MNIFGTEFNGKLDLQVREALTHQVLNTPVGVCVCVSKSAAFNRKGIRIKSSGFHPDFRHESGGLG